MSETSALRQLDEASALLRGLPFRAWAVYFAGVLPFLGAFAWWWADSSTATVDAARTAVWCAVLMALFVGMRTAQSRFMTCLWSRCLGEDARVWTTGDWLRVLGRSLIVQPAQLLVTPLALLLALPGPCALAFFQNDTLLSGLRRHPAAATPGKALRLSLPWVGSLATGQALLGGAALVLFFNLLVLAFIVVGLLDSLAGVEVSTGFTARHLLNTTTWVIVMLPVYLVIDPLLRAWTVWRSFLIEARADGADLLVVLGRARPAVPRIAAALAVSAAVLLACPSVRADEPGVGTGDAPQAAAVAEPDADAASVGRDMDRVLGRPEYRWRLPAAEAGGEKREEGAFARWVSEQIETLRRWKRKLDDWLARDNSDGTLAGDPAALLPFTKVATYVALAIIAALLVFLLVRAWMRNRSERRAEAAQARIAPAGATRADVEREDAHASDRPSDEWVRLAQELAAQGEWRLSLRAWHLATLARLGEGGFIQLRRSKSDRDYERELQRRGQAALLERFSAQRGAFECRWYGRTPSDEETVRRFAEPWSFS